jgi:hypothetical protein
MFERFTERARRAVFYARYEASNYGSPSIETEHLLLGLLREDHSVAVSFPVEDNVEPTIRAEIEKRITRGEPIPHSAEVPLSAGCKKAFDIALETSKRLGGARVEPVHILIGLLGVETSMAAQILSARGFKLEPLIDRIAETPSPKYQYRDAPSASMTLASFLEGLKSWNSEMLIPFFAKSAQFIDAAGKRWNQGEIAREFETLFAAYGKKNADYAIEAIAADTSDLFVASVRWNNALVASAERAWMHRMSFVLVREENDWEILLAQVTPVDFSTHHRVNR